jgi:hypothetical protein
MDIIETQTKESLKTLLEYYESRNHPIKIGIVQIIAKDIPNIINEQKPIPNVFECLHGNTGRLVYKLFINDVILRLTLLDEIIWSSPIVESDKIVYQGIDYGIRMEFIKDEDSNSYYGRIIYGGQNITIENSVLRLLKAIKYGDYIDIEEKSYGAVFRKIELI